jgi:dTDP-4-amino-4,6-dideoxygalactose transaminase
MKKLAINGGERLRKKFFPYQSTIGLQERIAVQRVMESTQLSGYRGSWNGAFYGGTEVQLFEKEWSEKFNAKYAIACNSCTSALLMALAAVGVALGDEVLVSPYTMTCSATMPMILGAVPVFCDIEPDNFCISYEEVVKRTTKKTKAIVVVDIFGNPFDPRIYEFAKERGIIVIEDAAQAPGAKVNGEYIGKHSDMVCYSFTQGKHVNAGESGVITTNNPKLAIECRLLMNHKESVVSDASSLDDKEFFNLVDNKNPNKVGMNLRMTEVHAAIMREQLKKIDYILETKRKNCAYIEQELSKIDGITPCHARENCEHSYYVQPFLYDENKIGVPRNKFIEAFKAELMPEEKRDVEGTGILCGNGYIQPLYRMPCFGDKFNPADYPIVEDLWKNKLFIFRLSSPPITIEDDLVDVVAAFNKVYENRDELK